MVEIDLSDRPAVVTGASKGIGRAIVERFAEAGGDAVICSRSIDRVGPVAEEITDEHPGRVVPVECDVTDTDEVKHMVDVAIEEFGEVRVLVNNAGGSMLDDDLLHRIDDDTIDANIDVNLKGQLKVAREVLPAMVEAGGGSMVHMGSVNGMFGIGLDSYSPAKGGVRAMSRNLACHYGRFGVRSNVLAPGTIETGSREEEMDETGERSEGTDPEEIWLDQYPLGRFGYPEEVADATLFLASEMSSFITGAEIVQDGGLVAGLSNSFQSAIYQADDRPTRE